MWMVALILGCSGKGTPVQDDTDSVVDTGTPWPDDTDAGTDEDADGWTVEEGDCDDTNIYVNPARDEDIADGLDNDCDGRVDEQFSGIVALQVGDGVTNPHKIVGVDPLGAERFSVDIQATEMAPYFLTWGVNGGWLVGDLANAALWTVAEDGSVTELTNFMGTLTETMRGLTTHPDGYYLVTTIDSLQKVDAVTGEKEELANFLTLPEDPPNSASSGCTEGSPFFEMTPRPWTPCGSSTRMRTWSSASGRETTGTTVVGTWGARTSRGGGCRAAQPRESSVRGRLRSCRSPWKRRGGAASRWRRVARAALTVTPQPSRTGGCWTSRG